jgi:hypothetical protein
MTSSSIRLLAMLAFLLVVVATPALAAVPGRPPRIPPPPPPKEKEKAEKPEATPTLKSSLWNMFWRDQDGKEGKGKVAYQTGKFAFQGLKAPIIAITQEGKYTDKNKKTAVITFKGSVTEKDKTYTFNGDVTSGRLTATLVVKDPSGTVSYTINGDP